jgi:hypothetical protein
MGRLRHAVLLATASIPMMFAVENASSAATAIRPKPGAAAAPARPASPSPPAAPVGLPKAYESVVLTLGTLTASGAATLKTKRSDERALAIRAALTNGLVSYKGDPIQLDKDNSNPDLGETALLCKVRTDYVASSNSLNFLTSLLSQVTEISKPTPQPGDLVGALKLLFATSGYSITDTMSKVSEDTQKQQISDACAADLKSYDKTYYGMAAGATPEMALAAPADAGGGVGLPFLNFMGPIGTLVNSFFSVLQPIAINAATIADQAKRERVIVKALSDQQAKIGADSKQLAVEVDNFTTNQRLSLAGSFVEQLVAIREKPIDLSKFPDCKNLGTDVNRSRRASGAPNALFITCWRASWAQIEPEVTNLLKLGDGYDALADAGSAIGTKQVEAILTDYTQLGKKKPGGAFWDEVTQFVTFANAVADVASKGNLSGLGKEISTIQSELIH